MKLRFKELTIYTSLLVRIILNIILVLCVIFHTKEGDNCLVLLYGGAAIGEKCY